MSALSSPADPHAIAAFADALPVAVWVGRSTGECVYANPECGRVLGLEADGAGRTLGLEAVRLESGAPYPEDQLPHRRVVRSKQREVVEDLVVHRLDGKRVSLRVFAAPILDERGDVAFVVEAFIDKTREVDGERQRVEFERQLQAVQRLESIGSLAGGVAHDFNNLLSIVNLVAGELKDGETNPDRLELITHLSEVSASAAKLTRALLGFARRGKNLGVALSLNDVVANVVELAARTFERRLDLRRDLLAQPSTVKGDPSQLEAVVMNLLLNAREAIADKGVITVHTRNRHLKDGEHPVLAGGDYVELEVEDTGGGVDDAVRDRVFEPYVTTKTIGALKGTGLGLATVFGIARTHGGHAEIGRTGLTGTVMRVLLPQSSLMPEQAPTTVGSAVPGTGLILIVDDDNLVRKMTTRAVEALGYTTLVADSGAEGVRLFSEHKAQVKAVLLDMIMPGMSGKDTYLALRSIDPGVRVLLTTGFSLNNEAQQILDLGVRGLLSKPFDMIQLSAALDRTARWP